MTRVTVNEILARRLSAGYTHGWIPYTAGSPVPPPGHAVLVQYEDPNGIPDIELGERRGSGDWYVCGGTHPVTVTHWQPLPEMELSHLEGKA